jgi:hypothetical protein
VEINVDHGLHLQHTQDEKCLLLHQLINEILWLVTIWQYPSVLIESIMSLNKVSSHH